MVSIPIYLLSQVGPTCVRDVHCSVIGSDSGDGSIFRYAISTSSSSSSNGSIYKNVSSVITHTSAANDTPAWLASCEPGEVVISEDGSYGLVCPGEAQCKYSSCSCSSGSGSLLQSGCKCQVGAPSGVCGSMDTSLGESVLYSITVRAPSYIVKHIAPPLWFEW